MPPAPAVSSSGCEPRAPSAPPEGDVPSQAAPPATVQFSVPEPVFVTLTAAGADEPWSMDITKLSVPGLTPIFGNAFTLRVTGMPCGLFDAPAAVIWTAAR